jgi:intein/homing endonuclease
LNAIPYLGTGDTLHDWSGNGNHGKIYGAKWIDGEYGWALSFDGMDDYCLSEDTEVLTKSGWKLIKDVNYGDEIATLNPETDIIEYQKPSNLFEFQYNGVMCHFDGRHLDLMVTPDHKVFISRYKSANDWYPYELARADSVLDEFVRFKKDGKWIGEYQEYFTLPSIPERQIPMNLWLQFFGWWISEGSINIRKGTITKSSNYQVIISQSKDANSKKCEEIEELLEKLGWSWSYSQYKYYIQTGYNKQLCLYLSQFGKARNKYIPEELKQLPPEQLQILFYTLMEGDGHRNQYSSVSKRLVDDIQEICLKLGYSADVSCWNNRRHPIWTVGIEKVNTKPRINEYRSNRETFGSAELVNYDGIVYGITVPKYHIIYVRRNGKGCWVGNCDCGERESLNITDAITIEAWVKTTDNMGYIVTKMTGGWGWDRGYSLSTYSTGFILGIDTGPDTEYVSCGYVTNIWDDKWHHVVGVGKSYDKMRLYVDGKLDSVVNFPYSMTIAAAPLRFSHQPGWSVFKGLIDEVRIYNRALSADEVKSHFEDTRSIFGI